MGASIDGVDRLAILGLAGIRRRDHRVLLAERTKDRLEVAGRQ
jgi:hypothetical protein